MANNISLTSPSDPIPSAGASPSALSPSSSDIANLNIPSYAQQSSDPSKSAFGSTLQAIGTGLMAVNPLLGAGVSLLGFLMGRSSNKAANQANQQIAANTNATNIQLAREQQAYQYKMWKENNAYNTPANQLKRLRDAGINPAFALGQVATGNSTSPADSPEMANQQIGTPMVPFDPSPYTQQFSNTAINFYNAQTQRMAVESQMSLNEQQRFKMQYEQGLIDAQTTNARAELKNIAETNKAIIKDNNRRDIENNIRSSFGLEEIQQKIGLIKSEACRNAIMSQFKKYDSYTSRLNAIAALRNADTYGEFVKGQLELIPYQKAQLQALCGELVSKQLLNNAQASFIMQEGEWYLTNRIFDWIGSVAGGAKNVAGALMLMGM